MLENIAPHVVRLDARGHLSIGEEDALVVIAGPLLSGKTTFVQTIAEDVAFETETPISIRPDDFSSLLQYKLDHYLGGRIRTEEGMTLLLYDTPSSNPADVAMLERIKQFVGGVVVVNSALPQTFYEAKAIIERFRLYLPQQFVIAANPYMPDGSAAEDTQAWDFDDLRIIFRVSQDVPVLLCDVRRKADVKQVLLTLLEHTLR